MYKILLTKNKRLYKIKMWRKVYFKFARKKNFEN